LSTGEDLQDMCGHTFADIYFSAQNMVSFRFEWSYHCRNCPLRSECVPAGQSHRTIVVGQHHDLLQQRRREQQTEPFKERMQQRNAIEGTISELTRAHGLRRSRYRGFAKVELQNLLIAAACNVPATLNDGCASWQRLKSTLKSISCPSERVFTGSHAFSGSFTSA
jgi:hypothetical protein